MRAAIKKWMLLNASLTVLIFSGAGTFRYAPGWVFLCTISLAYGLSEILNLMRDRELFERRVAMGPAAEREVRQKIIQSLIFGLFAVVILTSAYYGKIRLIQWVPIQVAWGYALIISGFFLRIWTFRTNTFAATGIASEPGQHVVTAGPYSKIRHPMYLSVLMILAGTPLALGSAYGELPVLLVILAIAWRALEEERFLKANLPGYSAYAVAVPYRLFPSIW